MPGEQVDGFGGRFLVLASNSFHPGGVGGGARALLALLLGFAARDGRCLSRLAGRIVGLGYAVPGSVIAVGVLIPVTRLDHWLAGMPGNN
jgi:iron(III) transport system permease protein